MVDVFQKDNEGITLKIKIKPRHLERIVYLTIIFVLLLFVFMDTFCGNCEKDTENETENETIKQSTGGAAEAAAAEEEEQNESAVVEEIEEPEINETAEVNQTEEANETEEEEIIEYSGNVELTINEVMTQIKGDTVQYGKITGVRFTINNEKEDFMPKVEVYTYEDGDTSSVFARVPRAERVYSTIKLGKSSTQELDNITSQQFTDLNETIVCKVVVKDKETDEILVSEEEKFKIT